LSQKLLKREALMAWETMFGIASKLAFLCWLALIFLPRKPWLRTTIFFIVAFGLCLTYGGIAMTFFFRVEGGGFASIAQVQKLFSSEPVVLAGWIHYLAFDLFVGLWIAKHADLFGIPRIIQAIALLATFMFGPIGLLIYLAIKLSRENKFLQLDMRLPENKAYLIVIVSFAITAVVFFINALSAYFDERLLNGINIWIKPMKFDVSFLIYLATFAWALRLMSAELRAKKVVIASVFTGSLCGLFEIIYISLQAARGKASHFNYSTAIEVALYGLMGLAAIAMVVSTFIVGLALWRERGRGEQKSVEFLGMAVGLMLGSVLTLITALTLGSGAVDGPGHWVGGIKSDTNGLWLLGWSTTGGDLRVSHFFATHLMQAIPLVGLIVDRLAARRGQLVVIVSALLGVAVVALTFRQALSGIPFLS
jgi:Domain of unknown function (DUF4281)